MKSAVRKWGNSAAVRIPAAARLEVDALVDLPEENGRVVIEPWRPTAYRLQDLLKGIRRGNLHAAVDFGRWGREVW
ncbi:MAG: AbrB/MazE/SpoVT family DNA-binding domain-containing protein [Terriglobales bacterium]